MADAKNKQQTTEDRKTQKIARKAAAKNAKKKAESKAKAQNVIMATFVIVILALAIVLFAYKQVVVSGVIERHTVAVSSENYSVSNAMMTYYFNSMYQNVASYATQMGLDTSTSLKDQDLYSGYSWYDYILSQATSQAEQYLILKEAAKAEGFTLDKEDYEEVDEVISSLKAQATSYGYSSVNSFVKLVYGSCVNIKDIEKAVELMVFAEKYADKIMAEGEYDTADYEKYFGENSASYTYVDYLKYSFSATADDTTGEYSEEDIAQIASYANELASSTTEEEFKAYVKDYLVQVQTAELEEDEELDEDSIDTTVEALLTTHTAQSSFSDDIAEFLFGDGYAVGATFINDDSENGSYTVYMKASDSYRDDYTLRNVQTIFISDSSHTDETGASEYAATIVEKWEATDKSADAFEELAEKYTEDTHTHGAQVVKKDATDYTDWLYDESISAGDVTTIVSSSDSGVYIVYYAGEDEMSAWEYDVDSAIRSADYSSAYSEFAQLYWVYENEDHLSNITEVSLSS